MTNSVCISSFLLSDVLDSICNKYKEVNIPYSLEEFDHCGKKAANLIVPAEHYNKAMEIAMDIENIPVEYRGLIESNFNL